MLKKLIKFEFQACGRILLPLYAALLSLALINGLTFHWNVFSLSGWMIFLTSLLTFAVALSSLYLVLQRFWINLLKNEGYLMFTLPVKTEALIWSKLLSSLFWMILSLIVGFLAMMLWLAPLNWASLTEALAQIPYVYRFLSESYSQFGGRLPLALFLGSALLLVFGAYQILIVYTAMAASQMACFHKHRTLAAVGLYIAIHFVIQNSFLLVSRALSSWDRLVELMHSFGPDPMLVLALLLTLGLSLVFFQLTRYFLTRHLNLE